MSVRIHVVVKFTASSHVSRVALTRPLHPSYAQELQLLVNRLLYYMHERRNISHSVAVCKLGRLFVPENTVPAIEWKCCFSRCNERGLSLGATVDRSFELMKVLFAVGESV